MSLLLPGASEGSGTRWQRVRPRFREYLDAGPDIGALATRTADPDFDLATSIDRGRAGDISQGVLVAGIAEQALIDAFNILLGVFREHFAGGSAHILGHDVAISLTGNVQLLEAAVSGNGRGTHVDTVNDDVVRKQNLQHRVVLGVTAIFAAIRDHEDDLATGL